MSVMRRFQVGITYDDYDRLVARATLEGRSIAATAQRVLVAWLHGPESGAPAVVEQRGPVTPPRQLAVTEHPTPTDDAGVPELKYEPLG